MELNQARAIAEKCAAAIAPGCKRVEIAGGIRRGKHEVNTIELVVCPDLRPPKLPCGKPFFNTVFGSVIACQDIPEDDGFCMHPVLNGPRFKKFTISMDGGYTSLITLDLYIVMPPAQFGVIYFQRTGPADFIHWALTHQFRGGALRDEFTVNGGAIHDAIGRMIITPDEINVLNLLGLEWIDPKDRTPRWQVNPVKIQPVDASYRVG